VFPDSFTAAGDEVFETSAFQKTIPTLHNATNSCCYTNTHTLFQQANFLMWLKEKTGYFWQVKKQKPRLLYNRKGYERCCTCYTLRLTQETQSEITSILYRRKNRCRSFNRSSPNTSEKKATTEKGSEQYRAEETTFPFSNFIHCFPQFHVCKNFTFNYTIKKLVFSQKTA